uniref:KIAA1522 n=1 Tax=Seriola dumerili TaxID=41447 RepID=A0A3B4T8F0_SERDU
MVVYLRKSLHSLLSVFKKKDQKRLTVHYTTSQHHQENVFIEGSRPQYLEDLHTEAQEGLKILQQESTFKPLNPVKRLDKSKKRTRRTTIMGIPNQVQKELPVMSISPQATYLSTIIPNAVLPASIEVIEIDRSSRTRGSSVNHGSGVRTVSKSSLASGDLSVSPLLSRRSEGDGSQTEHSCNDSTPMPASTSGSNWSESQSSKTMISNSSPVSSKGSRHSGNSQRVGLNGQESQQEHAGGDQDLVSLRISVCGISSPNSKSEHLVTGQGSESGESGSVTAGEDAKNKRNFIRSLSIMKTKQPPAPPRRTNSLHSNKFRSNARVLVESKDLNDSVSGEVETGTENTAAAKDEIKLVTEDTNKVPTPVSNSTRSSSPDVSSGPLSPTKTSSKEAGGPPEAQSESSSSSPQKTPSEGGKFERTMSPSSGYSSQSGTPTLSPKGISPTSPEKQKKKPVKPERSVSRASSSAASPSSSLTSLSSGTSEPVNPDVPTCSPSLPPQETPPTVTPTEFTPNNNSSTLRVEIRELLNIPPPPKVKAPCPPPPETWVHNRRTFELLCGPCPNVSKETHKPTQIQDGTVKQAGTQTKARKEVQVLDEKQIDKPVLELSESKAKLETLLATDPEDVHKEGENKEHAGTETKGVEASADVQRQEQSSSPVLKGPKNQETTPKKEPPPVMKKPTNVLHREELKLTEQSVEIQQKDMSGSATPEVRIVVENHTTSSQDGVTALVDKSENETDRGEVPSMHTLSVEVPKINKISPPPTPPPPYHPTPPPSRKTPPSSVSMPPDELQRVQEETHFVESCWPPPPPPLEGDSVFDGGDEVDFPPPPPPFVTDAVPDVMDSCVKQLDDLNEHTVAVQEVGGTIKDPSEAVTSIQEQNPDLPSAVPQLVVNDNKPEEAVQVSKANTADEISCRPVENVSSLSDGVPLPPVEAPPLPPITRAENPVLISALVPSSSFLKRDSVKIEDQCGPPVSPKTPIKVPAAPPLPADNLTHGVNFRRQPSVSNRDTRSKELLSRHKSAPIPKEDANIPLVTPSLLQMVRLRSVNMTEDQVKSSSEDRPTNEGAPLQENCSVSIPGPQNIPQKPIRKSLSLKSPPQTVKASSVTLNTPSMRLQEAIRMKTAAMSSRDGLPSRLGVRSSTYSCVSEPGALSLKSPEGCDVHKSPASTASFIFSRSTKKVVIETAAASSPEAQASLKQSLAAELMHVSDQSRAVAFSNGGVKCDKVPPPVAKKPAHGSIS